MESRLKWSGSLAAQKQADEAFLRLKPKSKKESSHKRKRKKLARSQRRANRHKKIAAVLNEGKTSETQQAKKRVRVNYSTYIQSPEWQEKRKKFLSAVGRKCETCGSKHYLQVHHRHYQTVGFEQQKDVQVLCYQCHQCEHEKDGVTATDQLSKEFREIIG